MTINIKNDYPEFRITDTLHQLVDRLNLLTGLLDSNLRQLDSATNNFYEIIDSAGGGISADSDLVIATRAGKIDMLADSNIAVQAGDNLLFTADKTVTIDAGDRMFLDVDDGEIFLRANGTEFGALKKSSDGNYLEFFSNTNPVITFDSTQSASFVASLVMPSTGTYSPITTAKTVHGAINELKTTTDSDHASNESRIVDTETNIDTLIANVASNLSSIADIDSELSATRSKNISSRLDTIESQIILINDRLDVLEIFS